MSELERRNPLVFDPDRLGELIESIRSGESAEETNDLRERVHAARAWAKVRGQAAEYRAAFLQIEVEALVRIVELGQGQILSKADLEAATFLANMAPHDRDSWIERASKVSTVSGLVRTIEREGQSDRFRSYGRNVENVPLVGDELDWARAHNTIESSLSLLLDSLTQEGEPFTIEDLKDRVLEQAAVDLEEADPALVEGVREVCREAVRGSAKIILDQWGLPRHLTVLVSAEGRSHYVRVPTARASLDHLRQHIELRREQADALLKTVENLEQVLESLESKGVHMIGDALEGAA